MIGERWVGIICSKEVFASILCTGFCGDKSLKSINNKSSDIVEVGFGVGGGGGARVMIGLFLFDPFNWRTFDTTWIQNTKFIFYSKI
jgi:hypothetical protein